MNRPRAPQIHLKLSALGAACLLLAACTPASADQPIYGLGLGKDGDSLMIGATEVRLYGVDAPEWDQVCKRGGQDWACGQEAAGQLARLVTGKQVRCDPVGKDQHERVLARCSVGVTDVNRTMVSSGYAVAYRHYSNDYVSAESSAKANRRGLWSGTFEMPSDYRHAGEIPAQPQKSARRSSTRPVVQSLSAQPSGSCVIKGNRGSNGWIYHLPGMPFYERTKAEEIFCSEDAARAAGYRRARVR